MELVAVWVLARVRLREEGESKGGKDAGIEVRDDSLNDDLNSDEEVLEK